MAKNPINFTEEIRERLRPYAKLNDPLKGSEAAFVQECVVAIIELIETKPEQRQIPAIVRRVVAALDSGGFPTPANSAAARNQRVADDVRSVAQSAQHPKANEAAGNKSRTAVKPGQSPRDSDRRSSPKEKD